MTARMKEPITHPIAVWKLTRRTNPAISPHGIAVLQPYPSPSQLFTASVQATIKVASIKVRMLNCFLDSVVALMSESRIVHLQNDCRETAAITQPEQLTQRKSKRLIEGLACIAWLCCCVLLLLSSHHITRPAE